MSFFKRSRRSRSANLVTAMERRRLANTMPGQTGAVTAVRLGGLVF